MTSSFNEAFAAVQGVQQQAASSAAAKRAEEARTQARARAIAEPVMRELGIAVRQKFVDLKMISRFERSIVILPGRHIGYNSMEFGVTRDGYLLRDPHLRGPAGFEDVISKVTFLPENPREEDVRSAPSNVRVDHRGVVVLAESGWRNDLMDPPQVADLHVVLAETVADLHAHPQYLKLWKV